MDEDARRALANLERGWHAGRIPLAVYNQQKFGLLKDLCERGQLIELAATGARLEEVRDHNGTEFCLVEAGPFIYGPEDQYAELKASVFMSKYPVTRELFLHFLTETGWPYSARDREALLAASPYPNCPATNISWSDAKEYCRWLRKSTGEYYSLPHEIEWERAARGIDGRLYPWGNEEPTDAYACFQGNTHFTSTVPVNSFPYNASPYGCCDMVGNVWEWCLDKVDNPPGARILRGGAWCAPAQFANCVARAFSQNPEERDDFAGFRIIYLPGDMWAEYKRQYSGEASARKAHETTMVIQMPPDFQQKLPPVRPTDYGSGRPGSAPATPVIPAAPPPPEPAPAATPTTGEPPSSGQ